MFISMATACHDALSDRIMAGGMYVIWLSDTHYYGGRAVNFKVRWRTHETLFRKGVHTNHHAQAVYDPHRREAIKRAWEKRKAERVPE